MVALVAALTALFAWIFDRSATDALLVLAVYLTVSRLVIHPLLRRLRPVEWSAVRRVPATCERSSFSHDRSLDGP